jgi:hypothetical protein
MVNPNAFAVLRLMTSSNLVGCIHGEIGGLGALEDLVDEGGGAPERVRGIRRIGL